ncbi:response regulator transcription factor [Cysteiniphilum sp. 6C5]|uniref:response regulator transcription factor n=1 Tax=unclassified Cysteiniphilum TaxID=2610889 RepID=UPI003F824656
MQDKKILVIDDNVKLNKLISNFLADNGFTVRSAHDGEEGIFFAKSFAPDLIILDVEMPDLSGYEVCQLLRADYQGVILFLTCHTDPDDELKGLRLGADDYLKKPVSPEALLLRVNKILTSRTANDVIPDVLSYGTLAVDVKNYEVRYKDKPVELTSKEFELMKIFALNPDRLLKREYLYLMIKGVGYDGVDRFIDVMVSKLRQHLEDDAKNPTKIKTIWGKGYIFCQGAWE